jgi:hypothetical protein
MEDNTLKEEFLYLVTSKDKDEVGNSHVEIAQYRKGAFWFFGWEHPELVEKFESYKELIIAIKE